MPQVNETNATELSTHEVYEASQKLTEAMRTYIDAVFANHESAHERDRNTYKMQFGAQSFYFEPILSAPMVRFGLNGHVPFTEESAQHWKETKELSADKTVPHITPGLEAVRQGLAECGLEVKPFCPAHYKVDNELETHVVFDPETLGPVLQKLHAATVQQLQQGLSKQVDAAIGATPVEGHLVKVADAAAPLLDAALSKGIEKLKEQYAEYPELQEQLNAEITRKTTEIFAGLDKVREKYAPNFAYKGRIENPVIKIK